MDTARIGVVGTGWWATEAHIPGLIEHPLAEVPALCDLDAARAARAAEHYGVASVYDDLDRMLARESLDGVVIASSNATHFELARRAIDAGLHVLIEKPMTETAPEGRVLLEAAERAGTEIVVGHTFHYTRLARRARELITGGAIGEVELVHSLFASSAIQLVRQPDVFEGWAFPVHGPTGQNFSAHGQGQNQLTHSAALAAFVIDDGPESVHGYMSNLEVPVDAVDVLSVRFTRGALGTLASVGTKPNDDTPHNELRIFGSKGWMEIDMERAPLLTLHRYDGGDEQLREDDPSMHYPLRAPARNLADVALGRAPNLSPGSIAQWSVEIVDAAYRSAASGGPVTIAELYRTA
ncbi:MAG: Gfo/Idh/MocA family oxidoreductase [Chloroflexota bacterium]|nr:Gfo/Idh/MocA family oxidoreductase [Chloroflexota bacterium]